MLIRVLNGIDLWVSVGSALLIYFLVPTGAYQLGLVGVGLFWAYSFITYYSLDSLGHKTSEFLDELPTDRDIVDINKIQLNIAITGASMLLGQIGIFFLLVLPAPKFALMAVTFLVIYGMTGIGITHDFFDRNIQKLKAFNARSEQE